MGWGCGCVIGGSVSCVVASQNVSTCAQHVAFLLLDHTNNTPLPCPAFFEPPQNAKADIVVLTRLIPDAHGTSCNERLEPISGCQHARILRVPFRDREG